MAALDLGRDYMLSRVVNHKNRDAFLSFRELIRAQYPAQFRIAIVLDNFSPHLSTRVDDRVGKWAEAHDVELAYTPTNTSWLNRIERHFQALRHFALDGTDHRSHEEQNEMIRRYIAWAEPPRLRRRTSCYLKARKRCLMGH